MGQCKYAVKRRSGTIYAVKENEDQKTIEFKISPTNFKTGETLKFKEQVVDITITLEGLAGLDNTATIRLRVLSYRTKDESKPEGPEFWFVDAFQCWAENVSVWSIPRHTMNIEFYIDGAKGVLAKGGFEYPKVTGRFECILTGAGKTNVRRSYGVTFDPKSNQIKIS